MSTKRVQIKKPKTKKKSAAKRIKKTAKKRLSRVLQMDAVDRLLLKMAAKPYAKILDQIESGKKRLDEERQVAYQLGSRILTKAKSVRDSLIGVAKSRR
jgi:hypothetical protein